MASPSGPLAGISPPIATVSNTFRPGAFPAAGAEDTLLLSSDRVLFYVHSARLLAASTNQFGLSIAPPVPPATRAAFVCPDRTIIISLVLHAIYGIPCAQYNPTYTDLLEAIDALARYGVPATQYIVPRTPLFQALEPHIINAPLDVYVCAGANNLRDLAVHASAYLLGTKIGQLPDAAVVRMGPLYLKKLVDLRLGRVERLKALTQAGPESHAPVPGCDVGQQAKLASAWRLAAAYFVWDARPELTTVSLQVNLTPIGNNIRCPACAAAFRTRLNELLVAWDQIQRNI